MDPRDWQSIEALVEAALPLPPTARARFLEENCGGDESFCAYVGGLLANPDSPTALGISIERVRSGFDFDNYDSWTGRRIGAYRIIRPLGRGGMGIVFLALRDDEQFQQQVAIKVLRLEATTALMRTRFRQERQILAGLEHPNIARLLDGGDLPGGAPYLVMELVAGVPITEYCDANSLSLRERARLFLLICDAVRYAHQQLVVHRDLKPGNILVTAEGVPKLLDFGIAKMLDPIFGDVRETATGLMLMTLEYASPEQVRCEKISTASDIYSLGVVLYQLLTGRRPYEVDGGNPLEAVRIVSEQTPNSPGLGDELDHILLMALRKEPERRYGSVREFANDVQRWLGNRPVRARPDTVTYRVKKFIRRNRIEVTAAAALVLAIGAGVAGDRYQAARADRHFEQARSLANWYVLDLDRKLRDLPGATPLREEIVRKGLDYLRDLSSDAAHDPAMAANLAEGYFAIAEAQGDVSTASLGHFDQAIQSYHRACEIAEDLQARHQASPAMLETLGDAYLKVGDIHFLWGDRKQATEYFAKGITLAERSAAAGQPLFRVLTYAQCLTGSARISDGDPSGAMTAMSEGLRAAQQWAKTAPSDQAQNAIAAALRGQARAAKIGGDWQLAIEKSNEADEIALKLYKLHPTSPTQAMELVTSYLGAVLGGGLPADLDDYVMRKPQLERASALAEATVSANPTVSSAQNGLGLVCFDLGLVVRKSNPRKALKSYQMAIAIEERAVRPGNRNSHWDANAALFETFRGEALEDLGELRPALAVLRKALATQERLGRTTLLAELSSMESLLHIGNVELRLQNANAAREAYEQASQRAEALHSMHPRDIRMNYYVAQSYEGLGTRAMALRDYRAASEWFAKSLHIWAEWPQFGVSTEYDRNHRFRAAKLLADARSRYR